MTGISTDYPNFLDSGQSFNLRFTPPSGDVAFYTLVYGSGTAGVSGSQAQDSVDATRAIAVQSFSLLWFRVSANDTSANLNINQDHMAPPGANGENAGDLLHSGQSFAYICSSCPAFGDFYVSVSSTFNSNPNHTINCTLETYFNSSSPPISVNNF